MSRIQPADPQTATGDLKTVYDGMQKNLGAIPNIFKYMGSSPVALQAFLSLSQAMNHSQIPLKLREEIALAVGQENSCHYCLSAHTAIGKKAGLTQEQILLARRGDSENAKEKAILHFAKVVVQKRGAVSDHDVETLKKAGVSDSELVEIILLVTINLYTNYFNHIVDTPIDFPKVEINV